VATLNSGSAEHRERILAAIGQLSRLSELFQKRREQLAAQVGLTEHQWGVLEEIATEHFMPSMFARQRESSAAAVSKTLRQLIDKELVAVSVDASDGRQRRYELTEHGKAVLSQLRSHREQAIDHVWKTFGNEALQQFCGFAGDLSDKLETLIAREAQKTDTTK
jgi:DNA-binding MarR family transcriptional regulator